MYKLNRFMAICSLSLAAACGATIDQPGEKDPTEATGAPEIMSVTDAMSTTDPPAGVMDGRQFTAAACKVNLVYCADPRYTPHYPSFCQNGCNKDAAFKAAISICKNVCGSINCNTMYVLGGC